ncbi:MAG: hypothetical protein JJT81_14950 [Rubellimicrobium sp.]|nr:hypothetical protein [Rubellimicrobium sp.]
MPDLIRLYITQAAIGFAIAAFVVSGLLYFNVGNLWHLVTHSDRGFMAVLLLWLFNGIVFGSVQFAIRIMFMAHDDDDDDDDRGDWAREPVAVRLDR